MNRPLRDVARAGRTSSSTRWPRRSTAPVPRCGVPHDGGPAAPRRRAVPDDVAVVVAHLRLDRRAARRACSTAAALRASAGAPPQHRLSGPGRWLLALPVAPRRRPAGAGALACSPGPRPSSRAPRPVPARGLRRGRRARPGRGRHRATRRWSPRSSSGSSTTPPRPPRSPTFDAVLLGGAATPAAAARRAPARAGVRVVTTYGMTETCGGCVYDGRPARRRARAARRRAARRPLGGPVLATGYLGRPDLDAQAFVVTRRRRGCAADRRRRPARRRRAAPSSAGADDVDHHRRRQRRPRGRRGRRSPACPGSPRSASSACPTSEWGQAVVARRRRPRRRRPPRRLRRSVTRPAGVAPRRSVVDAAAARPGKPDRRLVVARRAAPCAAPGKHDRRGARDSPTRTCTDPPTRAPRDVTPRTGSPARACAPCPPPPPPCSSAPAPPPQLGAAHLGRAAARPGRRARAAGRRELRQRLLRRHPRHRPRPGRADAPDGLGRRGRPAVRSAAFARLRRRGAARAVARRRCPARGGCWPSASLAIARRLDVHRRHARRTGTSGLGEVGVFVFFGLVAVLGTTYTQAGTRVVGRRGSGRWPSACSRARCSWSTTCATCPPTPSSASARSPCGSASTARARVYAALVVVPVLLGTVCAFAAPWALLVLRAARARGAARGRRAGSARAAGRSCPCWPGPGCWSSRSGCCWGSGSRSESSGARLESSGARLVRVGLRLVVALANLAGLVPVRSGARRRGVERRVLVARVLVGRGHAA